MMVLEQLDDYILKKKKVTEEVVEVTSLAPEDEMESLNNKHYEKQMEMVRYILNLKKKGVDIRTATTKSQLAQSYVEMVYGLGEDQMDCYWRKAHRIKKEYKRERNEV